jgi:hypothetical protein
MNTSDRWDACDCDWWCHAHRNGGHVQCFGVTYCMPTLRVGMAPGHWTKVPRWRRESTGRLVG